MVRGLREVRGEEGAEEAGGAGDENVGSCWLGEGHFER